MQKWCKSNFYVFRMVSEDEKRAIVRRLAKKTIELVKMTLNVLDCSIWRGNQPIEQYQSSSLHIRLGNQLTIFDNVLDAALVEMEVERDRRSVSS